MGPIAVDPSLLLDAAGRYGNACTDAAAVITTLASSLDAHWGCAGTDSAGRTWSESYDPAAFDAVATGTATVNGFAKVHDLLAYTAVNHGDAEDANTVPPPAPQPDPAVIPVMAAPRFNGSYGGSGDAPFGWSLISSWLQGHTWPNGDPDSLRALSSAWSAAAEGLRAAADITDPAWASLGETASDEIPQALGQMDGLDYAVDEVAAQFEALGSACSNWARSIEDAHNEIFAVLAVALGAGLIIGGVVGFFTAGTGTPAVEAGVGSSTGAVIVGILIAFDGTAALSAGASAAVGVALGGVLTEVQPLLDAIPTRFDAASNGSGGDAAAYHTPPTGQLPGFPKAKPMKKVGPRYRARWQDDKGNIYEWDYQHGALEKYSKNGVHQGEFDPTTGEMNKPAIPGRKPGG